MIKTTIHSKIALKLWMEANIQQNLYFTFFQIRALSKSAFYFLIPNPIISGIGALQNYLATTWQLPGNCLATTWRLPFSTAPPKLRRRSPLNRIGGGSMVHLQLMPFEAAFLCEVDAARGAGHGQPHLRPPRDICNGQQRGSLSVLTARIAPGRERTHRSWCAWNLSIVCSAAPQSHTSDGPVAVHAFMWCFR